MSRSESDLTRQERLRREAREQERLRGDGFGGDTAGPVGQQPHIGVETRHERDVHHDESVPGLIKKLAYDLSTLFNQELALAKAEMTSAVKDVRTGVSSMAAGGGVLFAGFLVLLASATMFLGYWVALPWAALIVGGIVAVIGLIMVQSGRKKLESDLAPRRTVHSLKEDARELKRRAT